MSEILEAVGAAGAVALCMLLALRKNHPAAATRHRLALVRWLASSVCILGISACSSGQVLDRRNGRESTEAASIASATKGKPATSFDIELVCGLPPPGEDSELARLFDFAEHNEGEMARVNLAFHPGNCSCPDSQPDPPASLALACGHNPDWWLAERMNQYVCVQALGIAGHRAGVGSFCFPTHDLLPVRAGYSREQTATHQRISGPFLVNWEWSLGAPHVQLLLPD